MPKPPTADQYRRRAEIVGKHAKARKKGARGPLLKKQKALTDMADNEDWLEGKRSSKSER